MEIEADQLLDGDDFTADMVISIGGDGTFLKSRTGRTLCIHIFQLPASSIIETGWRREKTLWADKYFRRWQIS